MPATPPPFFPFLAKRRSVLIVPLHPPGTATRSGTTERSMLQHLAAAAFRIRTVVQGRLTRSLYSNQKGVLRCCTYS